VANPGNFEQRPFIRTPEFKIDIATSWTENRAVWTSTADNAIAAIREIQGKRRTWSVLPCLRRPEVADLYRWDV
jgi:hypothetical protein